MYSTGARGGHTHPDFAGEFCVGARSEGRYLLMGCLDKLDLITDLVEGAEQPVDAVTGITVYPLHAPVGEAAPHELRYVGHWRPPYSLLAYAIVLKSAFSAWRESSLVC
jgi:hypothetical protein